jgi:hypothetical protein
MQDQSMALLPESIIVYPELFEAVAFKTEEPTFKATFLIEKGTDLKPLREAVKYAAIKKWPNRNPEFYRALRFPIRDGDKKAVDEHGIPDRTNFYYNRNFIHAKSKWQVPVVNVYNEEIGPGEIYGGCIVTAYISFYGYEFAGNMGISTGLRAVCKISDGDPIGGGRVDTSSVFQKYIKEKTTFSDSADMYSREYNELGQQGPNRIIPNDQDPWGEPPQEPPGGMMRQPGDEEDIEF